LIEEAAEGLIARVKTMENLKLLCVLAHPDDESLGMGGAIAHSVREGVEVHLICATRGERGRFGNAGESPGFEVVGRTREQELRNAARVLGISQVHFLGYLDGDLAGADPAAIQARIAEHIRLLQPQVVATFGPDGGYGHPDHIAISQFTTAAVQQAAARGSEETRSHAVSKLYYMAWPASKWEAYQEAFKDIKFKVDGEDRRPNPWPDWAITTVLDTTSCWQTVWKAVQCHETQMAVYQQLDRLSPAHHRNLWGRQEFYRAFSLVNGGRTPETDLFEGLRPQVRVKIHDSLCTADNSKGSTEKSDGRETETLV
jgi:LmbE family N-acetylglucosaminyl deacetylase